jgi:DNA-binding GntR family transcriptional regulator
MKAILSQKSLTQQVYESLVEAICDGTLPPDARVTQDEVAERLDVSRLPVGQALRQLRAEGFLVEAGRRGLKVAPLDVDTVRSVYELRGGLDQISARLAARNAADQAWQAGEPILRRGRAAAAAGDLRAMIDADMAFHWLIYRLSGNRLIEDTMQTQWHHIRRIMLSFLAESSHRARVWDVHERILYAIAEGDEETAEQLAREHCESASVLLQNLIARGDGANAEAL